MKKKLRNPFKNLTKFEWILWTFSLCAIIASFFAVGSTDYANLASSVLGVTALIFSARGDAFGLILMLLFSLVYSFVSFTFKYYGEIIIYLCMQLPCVTVSLISWLKNPTDKGSAEVKIGKFNKKHLAILVPATAVILVSFYFILQAFDTENLWVSTLSVGTSFVALYLMALRLPAYALAFILNDIVLVVLWSLACVQNISYLAVTVCFGIFLINDSYTFICWTKRKATQNKAYNTPPEVIEEQ
ncbi:MAG: nicotinamide mononucleotide transporter [Clostridia bacterium]|nr:nicotinamide mononucleotide transporter [Clostridia bacterium]